MVFYAVVMIVQDNTMERVVLPFSGLASWVLILGGFLATLQVLGINIQPLLTVGGVSGIVVGLSAQSVMSNMISGINLVRTPLALPHLFIFFVCKDPT